MLEIGCSKREMDHFMNPGNVGVLDNPSGQS